MNRRILLVACAVFAIALLGLLPLRIGVAPFAGQGFTARQVAGTIWYGRIGELMFRGRRLGTFEASLDPAALLTGAAKLRFERLDDPDGTLRGALVSGRLRGLRQTSGRIGAAGLLGRIPIQALQFDDVTLLFGDGRCARASGRVVAHVASPLPGSGSIQFAGAPSCEGDRIRFVLTDSATRARIELYVRSGGAYRAWLHLPAATAEMREALAASGLAEGPEGWMMSSQGNL